jgi:hypothetical protein
VKERLPSGDAALLGDTPARADAVQRAEPAAAAIRILDRMLSPRSVLARIDCVGGVLPGDDHLENGARTVGVDAAAVDRRPGVALCL